MLRELLKKVVERDDLRVTIVGEDFPEKFWEILNIQERLNTQIFLSRDAKRVREGTLIYKVTKRDVLWAEQVLGMKPVLSRDYSLKQLYQFHILGVDVEEQSIIPEELIPYLQKPIRVLKVKKLMLSLGLVKSVRTAERRIKEWFELGLIKKTTLEIRNPKIKIVKGGAEI